MSCNDPQTFRALVEVAHDDLDEVWGDAPSAAALVWLGGRVGVELRAKTLVARAVVCAVDTVSGQASPAAHEALNATLALMDIAVVDPERVTRSFVKELEALSGRARQELVALERPLRGTALSAPRPERAIFAAIQAAHYLFAAWIIRGADRARDAIREAVALAEPNTEDKNTELLGLLRSEIPFATFRSGWRTARAEAT